MNVIQEPGEKLEKKSAPITTKATTDATRTHAIFDKTFLSRPRPGLQIALVNQP